VIVTPKLYNARQAVDLVMLVQVLGREAGNQAEDAIRGVAWSIKNRVLHPSWWGTDWESVIEKKWQYSSIAGPGNDPNLQKYPNLNFAPWPTCLAIAEEVYNGLSADPTGGAVDYFDKSMDNDPPAWSKDASVVHSCDIGAFHFFKLA
jgi:hypothetical protein